MMLESPVPRNWHAGFGGGHSEKGNMHFAGCLPYFFATLKAECVDRQSYATRIEARQDIFLYIEEFYNRKQLHPALGYTSPFLFEEAHAVKKSEEIDRER